MGPFRDDGRWTVDGGRDFRICLMSVRSSQIDAARIRDRDAYGSAAGTDLTSEGGLPTGAPSP